MVTRDAFLRAIIENPDDDAPRLIFADWLEEQGNATRAEFIRVQCVPWKDFSSREWDAAQRREDALMRQYRKTWRREDGLEGLLLWSKYRRGFVEKARMRGDVFLRCFRSIAQTTPIQTLHVDVPVLHWSDERIDINETEVIVGLVECKDLVRLQHLRVSVAEFTAGEAVRLARCPYIKGLRSLTVSALDWGPRAERTLMGQFGDRVRLGQRRR